MLRLTFLISEDYERRTGGWVYDRRLLDELRRCGWTIDEISAPAGFPHPDADARAAVSDRLERLPDGTLILADQLVISVLPKIVEAQARRLRLVSIVHHALCEEAGPGPTVLDRLAVDERRALAGMRRIIVTSAATADYLRVRFGVPQERITVAPPGFDAAPRAHGGAVGEPMLLAVGAVVPRKAHDLLIEALASLADRRWRLSIVGSLRRAPEQVRLVRTKIAAAGLTDRIVLTGEIDDAALERIWAGTDLFVSSSHREGFGMAIGEAIARGLPVVATDACAVGGWVDRRAVGVVPSGDASGLSVAIARLLDDPGARSRMREAALAARAALRSWGETGRIVDVALRPLVDER